MMRAAAAGATQGAVQGAGTMGAATATAQHLGPGLERVFKYAAGLFCGAQGSCETSRLCTAASWDTPEQALGRKACEVLLLSDHIITVSAGVCHA
mmetsp:Transcript_23233/g.59347  ORF Transcript_23233/g.59347 Transcript_23233/m.59347 type:complete len:95 (+) Transcript_23233:1029-1313(+)